MDAAAAAERGLIVKKIDHNEIDDATALKNAGLADLDEAGRIAASIEASAVDLADAGWDVPRLRLGHRNPVQPARNSAVQLLPISRISVDLINPGSGQYTFSQEFKTLTQIQMKTAADATHAGTTADNAATPESVAQQIAQAETKYADYVSKVASSSEWTWKIWNSGALEAEFVGDVVLNAATSYAAGLVIMSGTVTLPFETVDTGSVIIATVNNDSGCFISAAKQTAVDTIELYVIAPAAVASEKISINLWGRNE